MDTTLNRPEIVAEVAALFERYEQAPRNVSDEVVARVQGTK